MFTNSFKIIMKFTALSIITAIVLSCAACNKNGNDIVTPLPPSSDTIPVTRDNRDVYLAGQLILPGFLSPVGAYWKNDSLVQLTTDSNGYSFAHAVTVSG